jgi:hypothetical protein
MEKLNYISSQEVRNINDILSTDVSSKIIFIKPDTNIISQMKYRKRRPYKSLMNQKIEK